MFKQSTNRYETGRRQFKRPNFVGDRPEYLRGRCSGQHLSILPLVEFTLIITLLIIKIRSLCERNIVAIVLSQLLNRQAIANITVSCIEDNVAGVTILNMQYILGSRDVLKGNSKKVMNHEKISAILPIRKYRLILHVIMI